MSLPAFHAFCPPRKSAKLMLWTHPGDEGQRYASLLWYRDPEHLRARQHDIGGAGVIRRCARGPEEQFAPDLALLVSLVADKSLTPQTGPERNWRDIARVADELRDRRVGGKAVFRVEP